MHNAFRVEFANAGARRNGGERRLSIRSRPTFIVLKTFSRAPIARLSSRKQELLYV
jgi:hypothetical protein